MPLFSHVFVDVVITASSIIFIIKLLVTFQHVRISSSQLLMSWWYKKYFRLWPI